MQIPFRRFRLPLGWAWGIVLCCVQPAAAARLLHVTIEQDGNVIAQTYYDDGGRADAATVWRYLRDPPIMVDDDVTKIEAGADNPLKVDLEGDLIVRFQHTTRTIAQARLSTLKLQRADKQTQAWFLPAAEVERTAGVAGLGPPAKPLTMNLTMKLTTIFFPVAAFCALMVVGFLVAFAFLVSRRPVAKPPD